MKSTASRAGASAQVEYRRRLAGQFRRFLLGLPAVLVLAAVAGWWAAAQSHRPLAGWAAGLVLVSAWTAGSLTPRPGSTAWRSGAAGERATARLLRPLRRTATILHDRALPRSAANVDHVVVARSGVWLLDSKAWRSPGARVTRTGRALMYGRYDHTRDLATVRWEAGRTAAVISAAAGQRVPVRALIVVHGARVGGWRGLLDLDGIVVIEARRVRRYLRQQPAVWSTQQAAQIGRAAERALPPRILRPRHGAR